MAKSSTSGQGRPTGAKNKRTILTEQRIAEAAAAVSDALPEAFQGDSHALLMLVYKDLANPIELRLDAAKAAISYEKPRLSSTTAQISGNLDIRKWLSETE